MGDPNIERLREVWTSIGEACSGLDDAAWETETACPGWTVKDQLSHLVAPEVIYLGRPQPSDSAITRPYVRNAIGAVNEAGVDYRRGWAGDTVLEEFREVTSARLQMLDAMSEEDLDEESWTPTGPGTYRDLLAVRAFDAWVHEQDIRTATGRPGHLSGDVPAHALQRCFSAMPFVVGKKAGAPDGTTVVFDVTGPTEGTLAIGITDGRANPLSEVPAEPAVRITATFEAFTRVSCGRVPAEQSISAGDIRVEGDGELGRRIVHQLPFMI
ncbi:MAG TPA: maleylpyruvate isomerase family mycothiol-dependent enzyme [Acidimicrobiales bacterium]|nr:maleylpyruvate isomerase family mycothiol-dependent enzyme [Acidimicrobiales bacterium]